MGTALGVLVFKRLPSRYRSETLIMVIPQRIPDSYVKPTVTGSVEDRLPTINDQILSRSRLERIINDFNLYKEQRATGLMEDVVQKMRTDIDVKLVGEGIVSRELYQLGSGDGAEASPSGSPAFTSRRTCATART